MNYCISRCTKAYDSVDHRCLMTVLKMYRFDDNFINMFKVLYNNCDAVVQINGHLSTPFELQRGVKQGDALSVHYLLWQLIHIYEIWKIISRLNH